MAAAATYNHIGSRNRILVASADPLFRKRLMKQPVYAESLTEEAEGGAHALSKLLQFPCDNVLLDRHLPDLDAVEVAELIRTKYPQTEVELFDSQAVEIERQATEIVQQPSEPFEENLPADPIANFAEERDFAIEEQPLEGMIGSSRAIQDVFRMVRMVAKHDTTVLVTGETGTGKELVAQAVHRLSKRSKHPFVVVNCAAIPEALLEAELFGHARGAFTGAVQSRLGRIHVAQGGTLFLDEIGELPLSMQAKLLRFLQNGEVQRLGSSDVYRIDVRVVCATNVNLLELVKAKQFRLDLYHRLAVFPIWVPPLRDRAGDIAALGEHFLGRLVKEAAIPSKRLSSASIAFLEKAQWSGNIREMQHAIERAFILSGADTEIGVECFQRFGEPS